MKKNERSVQLHVTQYEKMISELRLALATANEKIRNLETTKPTESDVDIPVVKETDGESVPQCLKCAENSTDNEKPVVVSNPLATFPSQELKQARSAWGSLFHDKREIQHKVASLEQLEKDFQYKIMLKSQKNDRVESISLSTLRYAGVS